MERLKFDSTGKLVGVDDVSIDTGEVMHSKPIQNYEGERTIADQFSRKYWSLYSGEKFLEPIKFSNNKTQEDVVREVVELANKGTKIIFIHGVCGTGKSAIALNIARALGRASIVVPVKNLQRQYEEDYMSKKFVVRDNKKLKIAMITGRDNHDSVIKPGFSCAYQFLPDTIKLTEKNYGMIKEFYDENPLIKNKMSELDIKEMRRVSIAPTNPYWSPIVPSEFEMPLKDAKRKKYTGLNGKEFIFYHRKTGCSYFDQYQSYIDSDVIIFNSAKYQIETLLDRKPWTDVDIIDEADEFLDSFSSQSEINLSRLRNSLDSLSFEDANVEEIAKSIIQLIDLEEKNKKALGVSESAIYPIAETKVEGILRLMLKNSDFEVELSVDELNYANNVMEIAKEFKGILSESYTSFRMKDNELMASVVSVNLSNKLNEVINKNKTMVLMSGTLHSPEVIKHIFGLENFKIVDAETKLQGEIEIQRTGKEIDCRYSNFSSGKYTKEQYFEGLSMAIAKAKKPMLVHVNAYEDLPSREDMARYQISNVMAKEVLQDLQNEDKTGRMISLFKSGLNDSLYSTKCARGVDFPGETCNSIVFTKYPNPNVRDIFWKILQKTHPDWYWEFYRDKARREFLQRVYRAVRSKDDHVFILSPDLRVLDSVREMQQNRL